MHTDPPPLAPEDRPFDWDEDSTPAPLYRRPAWIVASIIIILALIAGLASPIIALW
jgi:hypothetical protein